MHRCAAFLLGAALMLTGPLHAAQVSTGVSVIASDDALPDPARSLTFAWTLVSGPAGGKAIFTPSATVAAPTVTLDAPGNYTLRVTVGDGHLNTHQDLVLTVQAEPVAAFVGRFYQQCLERTADATGLANWRHELVTGAKGGGAVARGFVLSQEFSQRNLADAPFVDILYRAFFAREPDAAGRATWLAQLANGVLREDVLDGFVLAQEFTNLCQVYGITPQDSASARRSRVRSFVRRFYQQCLGREPDAAGIESWTTALLEGSQTGSAVAKGFILSQEFSNRKTGDAPFLTILYRAFFDREPDATGLASWSAALKANSSRAAVLDGFIGAPEFRALCTAYGIIAAPAGG